MVFAERIKKISYEKKSRIVLGLDLKALDPKKLFKIANEILDEAHQEICAVKINLHLLLPLGMKELTMIIEKAHHYNLQTIADIKLNDISSTNLVATNILWTIGFDAVISNPFVGFSEGLGPSIEEAHKRDRGILLLTYMSHKGAIEGYGLDVLKEGKALKMYDLFIQRAIEWKVDGLIVGATNPAIITHVKENANDIPIFSPGIIVQGGDPREAVRAGADYLIIARTLVEADNVRVKAKKIREATW